MHKIFLSIFIVMQSLHSLAGVSLPKIFGDNMVLQRNKLIPVWGWAKDNEKIMVRFNKQTKYCLADREGKWRVNLEPEKAGGPYTLIVSGQNSITFKNVLVGEVWICSGQSNMEMPIEGWGKINNFAAEINQADYPQIRHIKIPNQGSSSPKDDIPSGFWQVCSPNTAGEFTATGYFFARELYNQLKVPIGLVNTSWGGTMVETWTSRKAFEQSDEFKNMIATMPALDLDSLSKGHKNEMLKKMVALQGALVSKDSAAAWKEENFDDSRWRRMSLPGLWEGKGLNGVDGVVWFRRSVMVSAAVAGKEASLELAMIDDNDITYVNGVQTGSTSAYNTKRKYSIPAGLLKEGRNTIAIRIEDTGGGGGVYGEPAEMKLTIGQASQALEGDWFYHVESIMQSTSVGPNDYPTLLFNAMVNPLIPFAMRGVIWYQGETNAGRAYQYRTAFPLLIKDWRRHWKAGDFPFYFVQLASFNAANGNSKTGSTWAELREAQSQTLSLPNTGMAVTTDIGNATDIHPKNKQDVGKRLAAIALHDTYGKHIVSDGPVYETMQVSGKNAILTFKSVGSGLTAKGNGKNLSGFEIAGEDKIFHPAKAIIHKDKIIVSGEAVAAPKAIRFGWADDAGQDNLFNKEGFPAAPFRTDKWKGITENEKFNIQQ